MRAWTLAGLFILFIVFTLSSNANANPEIESRFAPGADGESVNYSGSIRIPSTGESQSPSSSARRVGPFVSSSNWLPMVSDGCEPSSVADEEDPRTIVGPPGDGSLRVTFISRRDTGESIRTIYECYDPISNVSLVPVMPPTYEEIWESLYSSLFNAQASVSAAYVAPHSPGLTGLETNVWAVFPDGQSISRDLTFPGGYRLQAQAYISEVTIFVTNPDGQIQKLVSRTPLDGESIDGGRFQNPLTKHVFKNKGPHTITTAIIWSGQDTILSGGLLSDPISIPIGDVRLELNRSYVVNELLPSLVD